MISLSENSALSSGEYSALFTLLPGEPYRSAGGNDVCRRGWLEDVALAMDVFRRTALPVGSESVGRCRGSASDGGAGGEVAE